MYELDYGKIRNECVNTTEGIKALEDAGISQGDAVTEVPWIELDQHPISSEVNVWTL